MKINQIKNVKYENDKTMCVHCAAQFVHEFCTNINFKMNDAENFNSLSQLSPIKVPLNFICY